MNDDTVPDGGMAMGYDGGGTPSKGLKALFFGLALLLSLCMAAEVEVPDIEESITDIGDEQIHEVQDSEEEEDEEEGVSGVATVHNVTWNYYVSNGLARVGVKSKKIRNDVRVPEEIAGYPVVGIKKGGFKGCNYVKGVLIPQSVANIGLRAFYKCSKLEYVLMQCDTVNIEEEAFFYCPNLSKVSIHGQVGYIEDKAFAKCEMLERFSVSNGVKRIGTSVFSGCEKLAEVVVLGDVGTIGEGAFRNCASLSNVSISNGVEKIMLRAFQGCDSLENITLPEGLASIGAHAFTECISLRSVTIPSSVKSIGSYVFSYCTSLHSVTIPEGVKKIGSNAFRECTSLKSLSIPGSVTDISSSAFSRCSSLTAFEVDADNQFYSACNGILCDKEGIEALLCAPGLREAAIPDGVENIADRAFSECYSLERVAIPDSVANVGDEAFSDCGVLTDISIPQSVTSIGSKAFSGCVRLSGFKVSGDNPAFSVRNGILCNKAGTDVLVCPEPSTAVVVPEGVVGIMNYAFGESNSLGRVFLPHSVTNISSKAFYECETLAEVYLSETYTGPTNVFPATAEIIRYTLSPMAIAEDGAVEVVATSVPSFRTLIEGAADMRLAENIMTEEDFASFLSWVGRLSTPKLKDVQESSFAWFSYAMDSGELATVAPTDGDVRIAGFVPFADGRTFDMAVSVAGVTVGNAATAANLSTLFAVEGASTPNAASFTTSGVDVEFCDPVDGKVSIRAAPKNRTANSFFFRVRMK